MMRSGLVLLIVNGGGGPAHRDRIIASNYADRQKAESLALAGKIDTNINANKGQEHKTK